MPVFFSINFFILQKWQLFLLGNKIYTTKHIFPIFFSKIHKIVNQNNHLLILYTSIWKEEISISFFSPPFWISSWYFTKSIGGSCQLEFFSFFPPQFSEIMSIVQQKYFIFHICAKKFTQNYYYYYFCYWVGKKNTHLSFLSYKETWLTWSDHVCCCWSNFGNVMHYHIYAYIYHCQHTHTTNNNTIFKIMH